MQKLGEFKRDSYESLSLIQQRDKYREILLETEKKLEVILAALPLALCIVEGETVVWCSDSMQNMTGYSDNDLEAMFITELFCEDEVDRFRALVENFYLDNSIQQLETYWLKKDGKIIDVDIHISSLENQTEEERFILVVKNVTQDKKASRKRDELAEQLLHAQKMEAVGSMAGGIAHDFNNILGVIVGYAEMALDEERPEAVKMNVDKIINASEKAKDVIKQILSFSRKEKITKRYLNLSKIVMRAFRLLRSAIPSSVEIYTDIGEELSPVYANSTQILQVIMNICTNAHHAMSDSGMIEVILREYDELSIEDMKKGVLIGGAYQKITIRDNGSGMHPEVMNRIFEPYYTTKDDDKGTGLGLAVVHGIVISHGGSITVDSEYGTGTEFNIYFPVSEERKVVMADAEKDCDIPYGTEKILLVDDDKNLSLIGKEYLTRSGYQVLNLSSSEDALNLFKMSPESFDLVLTDQAMPEITGIELAQMIKKIRKDIPVILCTGYSSQIDEKNYCSFGIDGFIMKPFIRKELAVSVRSVLDKYSEENFL